VTPEELQDRCAQYALDLLDPQAAAVLEAQLQAGDPEVIRHVLDARTLLALLPYALPQQRPDPAVRARVMAALHAAPPQPAGRRDPATRRQTAWFRTPWVWGPAAAALVLVHGWLITASLHHVDHVADNSRTILTRATEHEWFLNDFKILALAGTEHAPQAGAMVFWDTRRHRCTFLLHDLPPLGPSEVYQLWFTVGGAVRRSVPFWPATSGPTMLQVPLPADKSSVESALVTVEAARERPQPTGTPVLHGKF
jgi:hypothetical protein